MGPFVTRAPLHERKVSGSSLSADSLVLAGAVALWSGLVHASDGIAVDLPGGAALEMVWVEPGTFAMGAPDSEVGRGASGGPRHPVTISQGFYLARYETTQGQWQSVMGTRPWSREVYVRDGASHPAVDISWDDAQWFIHELNRAAGDSLYRLPTEAEWEYACRAGSETRWSFGDDEGELWDHAWYYDNTWNVGLEYAQSVGTRMPNPWGLFDMHGNVWEWCQDWYGPYSGEGQTDPAGPPVGSLRVQRGGDFSSKALTTRSAQRAGNPPEYLGVSLGVRLLRVGPRITAIAPRTWGQVKGPR